MRKLLSIIVIFLLLLTYALPAYAVDQDDPDTLGVESPPIVSDVTIEGLPNVGETLTGSYNLSDENTSYNIKEQWFIKDTDTLLGEGLSLVLTEDLVDQEVIFQVWPVAGEDKDNSPDGTPVNSEALLIILAEEPDNEEVLAPPVASDVTIAGVPKVGETLTGSYNLSEENTSYDIKEQWFIKDTETLLAEGLSLVLTEDLADQEVIFQVWPVAGQDNLDSPDGTPVSSDSIVVTLEEPDNEEVLVPPVASDVTIAGAPKVGETLTGSYNLSDENTSYNIKEQWFIKDTETLLAEGLSLVLTEDLADQEVIFQVWPIVGEDNLDSLDGTPVASEALLIILQEEPDNEEVLVPPVASDVTIAGAPKVGETLTGSYNLSDENTSYDIKEQWFIKDTDTLLAEGLSLVLTEDLADQEVIFQVWPIVGEDNLDSPDGTPVTSEALLVSLEEATADVEALMVLPSPPDISNVYITSTPNGVITATSRVGETLTGHYTLSDNSDYEILEQWFDKDTNEFLGEGLTLLLTEDMIGKEIIFQVQIGDFLPMDDSTPNIGLRSDPVTILEQTEEEPNLWITVDDGYKLYVNGHFVAEDPTGGGLPYNDTWKSIDYFYVEDTDAEDILIAVEGKDQGDGEATIAGLVLGYKDNNGDWLISDDQWHIYTNDDRIPPPVYDNGEKNIKWYQVGYKSDAWTSAHEIQNHAGTWPMSHPHLFNEGNAKWIWSEDYYDEPFDSPVYFRTMLKNLPVLSGDLSVNKNLIYEGDSVEATVEVTDQYGSPIIGETVMVRDDSDTPVETTDKLDGTYTVILTPELGENIITATIDGSLIEDEELVTVLGISTQIEHGSSIEGPNDLLNGPYEKLVLLAQLRTFMPTVPSNLRNNILKPDFGEQDLIIETYELMKNHFETMIETNPVHPTGQYSPILVPVVDDIINYMALEAGIIKNIEGDIIASMDNVVIDYNDNEPKMDPVSDPEWHEISYTGEFKNPVVIAQLSSRTGPEHSHIRIKDVDPVNNTFKLFIEEWDPYRSKTNHHNFELVSYLVIEEGVHELESTYIEVIKGEESESVEERTYKFSKHYVNPSVFSQTQTYYDPDQVWMRQNNIQSNSVDVVKQNQSYEFIGPSGAEQEGPMIDPHGEEIIGIVVIANEKLNHEVKFGKIGEGEITATGDSTTITSPAEVEDDKDVIFTATPAPGYEIVDWTLNGMSFGSNSNVFKVIGLDDDIEVMVIFEAKELIYHEVLFSAGPNGSISGTADESSITSGASVLSGSTVDFIASPNTNYRVDYWELNGERLTTTSTSYKIDPLLEDINMTVAFERIPSPPPPPRRDVNAVSDDYIIDQNQVLETSISELTENDSRVDSFVSVQSPRNGTVDLSGSTVTFTPDEDFIGSASFRYTVSGNGGTDSTSVNIQVLEGPPLGAILPYIMGYPDDTFKAEREVTRAELATIFARINNNGMGFGNSGESSYNDVPNDAWYYKYIQFVKNLGLFKGYDDVLFKPNHPVTKAEVAEAFSEHFDFIALEIETTGSPYTDIEGHWAEEMITKLYNAGISSQNADEPFYPDRFATRTEIVLMVNRFLKQENRDPDTDTLPAFSDVLTNHSAFKEVQTASGYTE